MPLWACMEEAVLMGVACDKCVHGAWAGGAGQLWCALRREGVSGCPGDALQSWWSVVNVMCVRLRRYR